MDGLENVISVLDYVLDTKRKRHIMGGILLSVSFFFWRFGNNRNDNQKRGGRG